MTIAELRAKYAAKMADLRANLTGTQTADSATAATALEGEITELRNRIGQLHKLEDAEAEERKRQEADEAAKRAGRPQLPGPGNTNTDPEERSEDEERAELALRSRKYLRALGTWAKTQDPAQLRALGSSVGSQGGFTIPTITLPKLTEAMQTFGGIAPYLLNQPTSNGDPIQWPTNNDNTNFGRAIGENVQATETDPAFASVGITVGLFSTDSVLVPRTLMQDSVIDIGNFIVGALAKRRARLLASIITGATVNANFDSLPGVATVGAVSAAVAAIGLPDMLNLYGAVDPAYAVNGKFAMHRSTQIYLSSLRYAQGLPVFPLDQSGLMTKFVGCEVVIDQNLPAVVNNTPTAGTKYVVFGDLQSYMLRTVGDIEVVRLEERYADYNQVGFLGWYRAGGRLIDAGTHPIQVLQQHA